MTQYEKWVRHDAGISWYEVGVFRGYVAGVADALSSSVCSPNNTTLGQVLAIVAKYFNEHPEQWSKPANVLIATALAQAFPCDSAPAEK
jgi:hypothetical protein